MRISGKLLPAEVKELRRLVRSPWYWPKLLLFNFHGLLIAGAVLCLTIKFAFDRNWKSFGLCLLLMLIVVGYATFATIRSEKLALNQFQQGLPEWLDIDAQGINLSFKDGRALFLPQTTMTKAVHGEQVMLLRFGSDGVPVFVPVSSCSVVERQQITDALKLEGFSPVKVI